QKYYIKNASDSEFDQEENEEKIGGDEEEEEDEFEISQVIEDAHVTLSTVPRKTEVLVTNSSQSSDLASPILNFLVIPHTYAGIVSHMDVQVHHEVPCKQTPILLTIHVWVITESSPIYSTVKPQSIPSFTPPPPLSTPTPPPTTEATNPLSTLLDFASIFQFNNRVTALENEVLNSKRAILLKLKMLTESLNHAILAKESSQPQSSYEAAASLTEFELKKIRIDKIDKSKSYLAAPEHRVCYDGLIKSYKLDKILFSTYDKVYSLKRSKKDKDKNEDPSTGSDRWLKKRKTRKDAEPTKEEPEFGVVDSDMPQDQEENQADDNEEPKGEVASKQKLDWENLEGGAYPFDLIKPLPLVMNGNRQMVPVDYFFNNDLKYLQGGILTMTYTTSFSKTKAAQYDLPSIKDMRLKYEELIIEGDFPILHINDNEDMVILIVQNRLTKLLGDDVSNFAIALRMFTRSIVIQKQVEDLQLTVESYQEKINVTKLMRSDELYNFSNGTLTRLQTSLEDINKNIHMEYLPKRRWSTLEKKRADIMIKAINKQLKEKRMTMSLEKFVGERHYGTDLRLL
nr:hypothetical protein [Tanacetum cinerariifolium]